MTDLNRLVIIGRLTRDAEVAYTTGGMAIGTFGIAVNHNERKGDEWTDAADFFDCKAFGKIAENLQSYLKKGKQVAIDGYLRNETWQDKETGKNRSKAYIYINNIQLLGGNDKPQQQSQDDGYGYGNN